jgi:hypothetical protein
MDTVMKSLRQIFLVFLCLVLSLGVNAQVTIGSNHTPSSNALLDLKQNADGSSSKGLLLPRVALDSTLLPLPMTAFVKGTTVYNTATAHDVSPGVYYSDGVKWVRIISVATDQTVEVSGLASALASPNDFSGATFSPATPASSDYIYINTADGTTWTYSTSSSKYLRYVAPLTTEWYLANGTTDAGADKTTAIYRSGNVGIGTNNPSVKLELNNGTTPGAIKIVDGTQGAGKVLVSDANGVGTWQNTSPAILNSNAGTSTSMTAGAWAYTGAHVSVTTAGYYTASICLITDKDPWGCGAVFYMNFSTSSTAVTGMPFDNWYMPTGRATYDLIFPTVIGYFNVGTYYLWAGYNAIGGTTCTSNVIRAYLGANNFTLTQIK